MPMDATQKQPCRRQLFGRRAQDLKAQLTANNWTSGPTFATPRYPKSRIAYGRRDGDSRQLALFARPSCARFPYPPVGLQSAEKIGAQVHALEAGDGFLESPRQRAARAPVAAGDMQQVGTRSAGVLRDPVGGLDIGFSEKSPKLGHGSTSNLLSHRQSISKLRLLLSTPPSNMPIHNGADARNNGAMDAKTARLTNLRVLIERDGSIATVARKTGTAEPYLSQILNSAQSSAGTPRGMGNKVARRIEQAYALPSGWMDSPHTSVLDGDASTTASDARDNPYALDADVLEEILDYFEIRRQQLNAKHSTPEQMATAIAALYPEFKHDKERDLHQRRARHRARADQAFASPVSAAAQGSISTKSIERGEP